MDKTRAYYRAVHRFALGTDSLAAAMGMKRTTLLHKANPHDTGQFFSPEEGIQLQQLTADHGGLVVEATELGYVLFKRPQLDGGDVCARAVNNTVREFSEFLGTVTEVLADGSVTANELAQVDAECIEAMAAISDLQARIAALHEAAKPKHEQRGAP